jgi:hypothetical protein
MNLGRGAAAWRLGPERDTDDGLGHVVDGAHVDRGADVGPEPRAGAQLDHAAEQPIDKVVAVAEARGRVAPDRARPVDAHRQPAAVHRANQQLRHILGLTATVVVRAVRAMSVCGVCGVCGGGYL